MNPRPRAQQRDLNSDHTEKKSITSQLCHQHPLLRFLSPTATEPWPGSSTAEETDTRALVVPGTEPTVPVEKEPGLTAALMPRQHCQSRARPTACPEFKAIPSRGTPYMGFLYQFYKETPVIKLYLRHLSLLK